MDQANLLVIAIYAWGDSPFIHQFLVFSPKSDNIHSLFAETRKQGNLDPAWRKFFSGLRTP